MQPHKKGQTVHSGARNVVRNIITKCDEEAKKGDLLYPVQQANNRIAGYSGLSIRTISRIRKESSKCGEGTLLKSPGTKRPRRIEKKFYCPEEDKNVIRQIIYDFYTTKKVVPSGQRLLLAIRENINFPWMKSTLYNLLKSMGYEWRRATSFRMILIEKPDIVASRGIYLKAMDSYRTSGRNIVYIDETWLDNSLSYGKCWYPKEELGVQRSPSSSQSLIIIHAGGKTGFVEGADLIFKPNSTSGDYHGQMNAAKFEMWVQEKLLPNIPPNAVIVMDNAPYHSAQLNRGPSKYARKKEMVAWLLNKGIPCSESLRKFELIQMINQNKPSEKTYRIDQILQLHGHNVLRLPPYMCQLNPMKLAWAELTNRIREKHESTLSLAELETFAKVAIDGISTYSWENYCQHVENIEKQCWEQDSLLEEMIDNFILDGENSDSETVYSSDSDDSSFSED